MTNKKILVFDEESFGRVCRALLQLDGYCPDYMALKDIGQGDQLENYDLIITSYPYGACIFPRLVQQQIPVLVLSDCLSGELLECLKSFRSVLCMVKPLDYEQFSGKIRNVMNSNSDWSASDGCEIL